MLSFNARNSDGGYEEFKTHAVSFRDGRLTGGIVSTEFAKSDGIKGLVNSMIASRMATCPTVPEERIQQIMSGSVFKPRG